MELKSEIIAYAPFWKSWNRTFQKWKRSRNHFSGTPGPPIFRKSEFSITPRRVSGGQSAAWFSENAFRHTFLDAKVCPNAISEFQGERKSQNDTLLVIKKCVILHFLMVQGDPGLYKTSSIPKGKQWFLRKSDFYGNQKWNHSACTILRTPISRFPKRCVRYDSTVEFHENHFLTEKWVSHYA